MFIFTVLVQLIFFHSNIIANNRTTNILTELGQCMCLTKLNTKLNNQFYLFYCHFLSFFCKKLNK